MLQLQQLIQAYEKDIAFIPVALDASVSDIEKFMMKNGLTFPIYVRPEDVPFEIRFIPAFVLLNADGSVFDSWAGAPEQAEFRKKLDTLSK